MESVSILGAFIMSQMTEEQVYEKLLNIVATQLNKGSDEIKKESTFIQDLDADSLDVVELVIQFEEEFDIPIADEDAGEMSTVEDALVYIKEAVNKKGKEKAS